MDISEIRRRNLRLIIEQCFNGTAAELARALGKQASEISRIFSSRPEHRRNVGSRLARQIETLLGQEAGWMDRQQMGLQDHLEASASPNNDAPAADTRKRISIIKRIPIISSVQAQDVASVSHFRPHAMQAKEWITVTAKVGDRAYALCVVGDSMEPKFPEGCTIIVDPDVEPVHGSFVIALLGDVGQITFKQLVEDGRRYLKPLNPRYPVMQMDDRVTICGVIKQMIMNFD